jgi:hypothetical protein
MSTNTDKADWGSRDAIIIIVAIIVMVSLFFAVDFAHPTHPISATATVKDLRIVESTVQHDDNDAAGGAVIGGMMAGTKGAIIGAIAGSGPSKTVLEPTACLVTVSVDSHLITFKFFDSGWRTNSCSLLKNGDTIQISHFLKRDKWNSLEQGYYWQDQQGEIH